MKELYKNLYDDCLLNNSFFNDAHFVSMQGVYYSENTRKFMLIGRATNGWGSLNTLNKETFGNEAAEKFEDLDRWNWIESINGTLYSAHDSEKNLAKRYCLDKKPYWSYTKSIWKQLTGSVFDDDIWQKNIVWSNLYKVSPLVSGNPDLKYQQIQRKACIEILKKELEIYQPTHILVVTGFDWFEPFSCLFENVHDFGCRNILRGKNKNEVYVEGTATYKNANVVIACRPEWRDGNGYITEVLKTFNDNL